MTCDLELEAACQDNFDAANFVPTAADWNELYFARLLSDLDGLSIDQLAEVRDRANALIFKPVNRIAAYLPEPEDMPF